MARKSLGFIPLIWTCAYCETQNPGPIQTCTGCGAPQPPDVKFTRVDQETFDFIKDEALIRMAKAGPDIHCPYCGTRNPSSATLCSNCGGDLSMGGESRETGQQVETTQEAKAAASGPPSAEKKKAGRKTTIFVLLAVFACIAAFIIFMVMMFKTDDVTATVTNATWERNIAIEAYTSVTDQTWYDEIPSNASIGYCTEAHRYTSDQPVANATEVCGEAYVEDTGTGVGEVVQDCSYYVYDDFCEYTYLDWVEIEVVTETGTDRNPFWPSLQLASGQREGTRNEKYQITFDGKGESYTYTTKDSDIFEAAQPGSKWTLHVNNLGGVQKIEPAN